MTIKSRSKVTNQPGQPIKIPICAIKIHKRWYQVYQVWGSIPSQESPGRKNLAMYPLVNKQFAIENGPVEIVDFPLIAWWFSIVFLLTFTRPGSWGEPWKKCIARCCNLPFVQLLSFCYPLCRSAVCLSGKLTGQAFATTFLRRWWIWSQMKISDGRTSELETISLKSYQISVMSH